MRGKESVSNLMADTARWKGADLVRPSARDLIRKYYSEDYDWAQNDPEEALKSPRCRR